MWLNIRAGLGPARPNEGTTWFRAGLGLCFYTSGWHDTVQKMFGLSWPEPVWHEARWAWAGLAWPGPIPSTTPGLLFPAPGSPSSRWFRPSERHACGYKEKWSMRLQGKVEEEIALGPLCLSHAHDLHAVKAKKTPHARRMNLHMPLNHQRSCIMWPPPACHAIFLNAIDPKDCL
jgi:hypothetical protein